jgi:hypothetical protein
MIVVKRDPQLLHIIRTLGTPSRFARRLDGRQQEGNQDSDNGNDHE